VINGFEASVSSSSRQILQSLESDNRSLFWTTAPRPPYTALGFNPRPIVKSNAGRLSGSCLTVGLYDSLGTVKSLF